LVTELDFTLAHICLRSVKRGNAPWIAMVSDQFQFPFLSNEILAETMMRLFFYQTEARSFVDAMRSDKNALGPENNFPKACRASEVDALLHQMANADYEFPHSVRAFYRLSYFQNSFVANGALGFSIYEGKNVTRT